MVESIYFVILCFFIAYFCLKRRHDLSVVGKTFLFFNIKLLPFVIAIIILTSVIKNYVPQDSIIKYLGVSSFLHMDIVLGAVFGCFFEGPTIIAFVIGAMLMRQGASAGAVTAFISSFSMIGLVAVPLEVKELGAKFTATRFFVTLLSSIVFGFFVQLLIRH